MKTGVVARLLRLEEQRLEQERLRLARADEALRTIEAGLSQSRARLDGALCEGVADAAWLAVLAAHRQRLIQLIEAGEQARRAAADHRAALARALRARYARTASLRRLHERLEERDQREQLRRVQAALDELASVRGAISRRGRTVDST